MSQFPSNVQNDAEGHPTSLEKLLRDIGPIEKLVTLSDEFTEYDPEKETTWAGE